MIQTPEAIFDPTPSGSFLNTADASTSKYDERYKMCHDSRVSKEDHKDRDALLIVVMTHGGRGRWENGEYGTWLYAHDNKYDINCLWSPFTADKCLTLANKPKIFFIQACQGYFTDAGQKIAFNREDSKTDTDKFNEPKPLKPVKPVENRPASFTIPNQADFMLCFSTIPGFVSFINPDKGTIFIQTLCKVLEKKSSSTHLMDMMTEVIRKIAVGYKSSSKENQEIDNKKQMPCIVSLMTRQVFFESRLDHPETAETEVNKDDVDLDRALKGLNAIKKQQHAINKQLEEVTINVKGLQRSSSRRSSIRRFFNIFRKKN